jgi:Isoleucyl-tRNA synthetase (EC 6.1.1.5)
MLDWEYNPKLIDEDLEEKMDIVRDVIEACARARDKAKYKLRWPVKNIAVVSEDKRILEAVESLRDIVIEQANTKGLEVTVEFERMKIHAKPNPRTLGPRLRDDMPLAMKKLQEKDGYIIKSTLESEGVYKLTIKGKEVQLNEEDIIFETELPEDIVTAKFDGGSVFVDTKLTHEILSEAMARELIRRIQDMRKDLDLDVEAHIKVDVNCTNKFRDLIEPHKEFIKNEVRAKTLSFKGRKIGYTKNWNISDEKFTISISRS